MLVKGDLGFSSLVFAAFLLVISLLIGRKWRQGQARQEEIKRLVVLASEEAARAEYEAYATYAAVPVVSSYQCAVCYSPTTTRCSRCKVLRYCSGKCQIVHWRQGHREECCPPPTTYRTTDGGNNIGCKAAEQDEYQVYSERTDSEKGQLEKPVETFARKPVLLSSRYSHEISSGNEDDKKVEFLANGKRSNSTSESCGSSFSGFSTCSGSESSDDVSISESTSSFDLEKPDGHIDTALDIGSTSGAGLDKTGADLDKTEPPSPKIASLVNSVNSFISSSKSNQIKSGCSNEEDRHASISSPRLSTSGMHETSVADTRTSSFGFWKRALDSSSTNICTSAGRYNDKGLFPYDMFVKLYNWNKVELLPCGLINCGNSCYVNAVLQCLAYTPPLTAYFLQGLHSKACAKKEWCFTCEFESLIMKAKEGNSPLSPIGIVSQLQNIGSKLGHGREEDAHEFLRYAIETLQSVCLKEAGAKPGSSEEETTLIGLTFGGYLRSKIKCMKCQGKSEKQERMMDLTVEIEGDIGTLEEALRQFTGTEILDGENKYHCSRCKSYEKAKKKLTVLEAPNVLTIALKRFQSGKFGKLNKLIRFPEILDLAPYMSGTSDKSPIYRLCGVVVHLDIMNAAFSGHYVCYVKNNMNKWFKIDDSMVKSVELERVLTKGAYMLLYSRCSPRAPRLIRSRIVTPDQKIRPMYMSSKNSGKSTTILKSKAATSDPSIVQIPCRPVSSDGSSNYESFYMNFQRLQKILEVDSSSDSCSLISSNSDAGSCSTDSTRDSSSADNFSDYIFGDSEHGWNSPWRSSSDSNTSSSSSSPLYSRHSSLADSNGYGDSTYYASEKNGIQLNADLGSKTSVPFLQSDTVKQCRKLGSSSFRETDSGRFNSLKDVKLKSVSFRKSTRTS